MNVHTSAVIHPSAKIGPNVFIGPFVVIGPEVSIGENSQILSHAVIEYTSLGKNCVVYPYASIGLPPQHLKYQGEKTRVEIGDNCTFRENVTVHRGTPLDKSVTIIGNNNYFMAYSHVAHDCVVGNNVIMANAAQLAGHVKIGNNCFISTTVGIHQFTRVGTGALVSGGAMVSLDVAPYCIAQGDRATIKGLNVVGLRRMGVDRVQMKKIKEAFRTVFLAGLPLQEALAAPGLADTDPMIKTFRDFFLEPKRGFTRPSLNIKGEIIEEEVIS